MCDLSMFVNYLILYVNIFTDVSIRKYDAVFDNSSFLDDTSTAQNGVVNRAFDAASVGNNRCFDVCALQILCRAGVVGLGIDRPVRHEQILCCFDICQGQVGLIVAVKI